MEEIKVGEYVRTKRGEICKVLGIRQEQRTGKRVYGHLAYYLDNHKGSLTPAFILKHSSDIIDLIEEGDYVNGEPVEKVEKNEFDLIEITTTTEYLTKNDDIKSIVTKEQFESIKYEV